MIAALAEGVVFIGPDMTTQASNASAQRILGLDDGTPCSRSLDDPAWQPIHEDGSPFHPDDLPTRVTMRTGRPCSHVVVGMLKPDGTRKWLSLNSEPLTHGVHGEQATPRGVVCSFSDITTQKQATDALAATNLQYRLLADHMADMVGLMEVDGSVIYLSPSWTRLTGYRADDFGVRGLDLAHPAERQALMAGWQAALAGTESVAEWQCQHKDGHYLWVETVMTPVKGPSGTVIQVVGVTRDATTRRATEERLRQSQKLEAIGHLAGGVAHDFNNLLTVVNGCGELLLAETPADSDSRGMLDEIVRAGRRGADLTRQLLAFSRQQLLKVEVIDPSRVLPETAKLLARLLGEDISLELDLDPAAGSIKADVGQLEQILINLAVNARDAMPTGGQLHIRTAAAAVTDADRPSGSNATPGEYVRFTVTDTGTGIPADVQARLFEPFFTTKPTGRGTGLGLATVYGIVRQSGGFLTVDSEVGRGTTFAVYLSRHLTGPEEAKAVPEKLVPSGSETVLVVEDDDSVRTLATMILSRQGYRVEVAEDGHAALAVCARLPTPPDVILTDIVMPGMGGRELAETLVEKYPRLKVVFLSGYTADEVMRHGIEEDRVVFLQKPYTPDTLSRFVREVLDGTNASPTGADPLPDHTASGQH